MLTMATEGPTTRIKRADLELLRRIAALPYTPEQTDLAEQTNVSKATIHRAVNRLVAAGLLAHRNSRRADLTLTETGQKLVQKSSEFV